MYHHLRRIRSHPNAWSHFSCWRFGLLSHCLLHLPHQLFLNYFSSSVVTIRLALGLLLCNRMACMLWTWGPIFERRLHKMDPICLKQSIVWRELSALFPYSAKSSMLHGEAHHILGCLSHSTSVNIPWGLLLSNTCAKILLEGCAYCARYPDLLKDLFQPSQACMVASWPQGSPYLWLQSFGLPLFSNPQPFSRECRLPIELVYTLCTKYLDSARDQTQGASCIQFYPFKQRQQGHA